MGSGAGVHRPFRGQFWCHELLPEAERAERDHARFRALAAEPASDASTGNLWRWGFSVMEARAREHEERLRAQREERLRAQLEERLLRQRKKMRRDRLERFRAHQAAVEAERAEVTRRGSAWYLWQ